MSWSYEVYGLQLESSRPIPHLSACVEARLPDLRVDLDNCSSELDMVIYAAERLLYQSADSDVSLWESGSEQDLILRYSDGVSFTFARTGGRLKARWPSAVAIEDVLAYLLGPILGFILYWRGAACLHASGIVIDGEVVALLGDQGAGKSTTAAAFGRLGYPILTDDIFVVTSGDRTLMIEPGYPGVRLWPSSVSVLFGGPDALAPMTPTWDKRYLDLRAPGYSFQTTEAPLGAIYVLDERKAGLAAPHIEAIPKQRALLMLLGNSYAPRYFRRDTRAAEFAVFGRIAASVPVRRVNPLSDSTQVFALCQAIVEDYRSVPA